MTRPVFLLSLPRSGSTLAQRILASHPAIATTAEPWILLPLLSSLRDDGVYTAYNHRWFRRALVEFTAELPGGEADYAEAIRRFAVHLYERAANGRPYFLDKTPRYHLVSRELLDVFPDARFVFLWRHPVAVAASISQTWGRGRWNLYHFKADLYAGVDRLVDAYRGAGDRAFGIRYEDMIAAPHEVWPKVFAYLELDYDERFLREFATVRLQGSMKDPTGVVSYSSVTSEPLTKWHDWLNPARRRWARAYLDWVGEERLRSMGYDLAGLQAELEAIEVSGTYLASDAVRRAYGFVYELLDTDILRDKIALLPNWSSITPHAARALRSRSNGDG